MAPRYRPEQSKKAILFIAILVSLLLSSTSIAQPFPDWHESIVQWINTGVDTLYYKSNNSATLSWGETYNLQTYNLMYQADKDTLWLHKLAKHGYGIMSSARDVPEDGSNYDPRIKDGFLGWGTDRYSDDGMYEEYLVHDGHFSTELAKFVHVVYEDSELYQQFGVRADSILKFLEKNVVGKWYSVWDSTLFGADGTVSGAYPKWVGAANLEYVPVNQYAAFGHFLLELIQISKSEHYSPVNEDYVPWYARVVDDMIAEFKTMLRYDPLTEAYVWDYSKYCCSNDISHSSIEVAFAFDCYRYGLGFSHADMMRFANTLTRRQWKNPPDLWNAELWDSFSQSEWNSYDLDYISRKWGLYGIISPLAGGVQSGVYRKIIEAGGFGSAASSGIATLAFINKKAFPLVAAAGVSLTEISGDGDHFPDPGESLNMSIKVANFGNRTVDSLFVFASSKDERIEITQAEAEMPAIASLDTMTSITPLVIKVKPDVVEGGIVKIFLELKRGASTRKDSVEIAVGPASILLVDDDGGAAYENYYTDGVLDSLAFVQYWNVSQNGGPGDFLLDYEKVIWFTGDEQDSTLKPDDREALRRFLDRGGKLLLFSGGVQHDLLDAAPTDTSFFSEYLHALPSSKYTSAPYTTLTTIVPEIYPTKFLAISSTDEDAVFRAIGAGEDAVGLLQYLFGLGGILTTQRHRVVYITFGLQNMQQGKTPAEKMQKRRYFMERLMSLLDLPSGISADLGAYPQEFRLGSFPNPFNARTTVTLDAPRAARVQVDVYDVRGRLVKNIFSGKVEQGRRQFQWDARDQAGNEIGSGVYLLSIRTPEENFSLKICHIK